MIASINYVLNILENNKAFIKKKYGQNFLIDANTVKKIALMTGNNNIILEIGPGLGALTEELLKINNEVYAYEIDKDMYHILLEEFKDNPKLKLELKDFLEVDLDDVPYKDKEIIICSNLPYYVTTPILFKLFESNLKIKKIIVMVQKEVAYRFIAKTNSKDYSALSIIAQYLYDIKKEMDISKNVFYPKPKIDSAIISFIPRLKRNKEYEKELFSLIKRSFKYRRKTLFNNLKEYYSEDKILNTFEKLNIKANVRGQELSLDDYIRINEVLNER